MIEVSIFKSSIFALFLGNSESALHTYDFCSRATVRMNAFEFLQYLQFLPPINCSGTMYAVVHCSQMNIAVISLYFHCTFTAKVCSELIFFNHVACKSIDIILTSLFLLDMTKILYLG